MMNVFFVNDTTINLPRTEALKSLASRVLCQEGASGNINLIFCTDEYMRSLNLQFRSKDKTTDVLSFEYGEEDIFGEIYISPAKAKIQAPEWENTFYQELKRLVVHGSLHLSGYDHILKKDRLIMEKKEQHYLKLKK